MSENLKLDYDSFNTKLIKLIRDERNELITEIGWSEAKTSKIINGRQALSVKDVIDLLNYSDNKYLFESKRQLTYFIENENALAKEDILPDLGAFGQRFKDQLPPNFDHTIKFILDETTKYFKGKKLNHSKAGQITLDKAILRSTKSYLSINVLSEEIGAANLHAFMITYRDVLKISPIVGFDSKENMEMALLKFSLPKIEKAKTKTLVHPNPYPFDFGQPKFPLTQFTEKEEFQKLLQLISHNHGIN